MTECTNPLTLQVEKNPACSAELAGDIQLSMPLADEETFDKYFYEGFLLSELG